MRWRLHLETEAQLVASEDRGFPPEGFRVNPTSLLRLGLVVLVHDGAVQADDMCTLVVLEELQGSAPDEFLSAFHGTGIEQQVRTYS
jgi:hypothetical protein